jgi:hypothetical protein
MTMIAFGDAVRIERHFRGDRWSVYRLEKVIDASHPAHRTETTETEVWVKVGEGNEDEAAAQASKLSGIG